MRGGLVVAIVVSVAMGRAQAQRGDASAAAEQLFQQGRELAQQNRWPEACAKFEDSLRYEQALGTQLNLAKCYKHIGKLASAWYLFCKAITRATEASDDERRDYAQKQADALEPRLPKIMISVPRNPPAGLVVVRDGAPIDAGALGVALYVDPGVHTITASAPGFEAFRQTVMLVEGEVETVAIPALVAVPERKRNEVQAVVVARAPDHPRLNLRIAGIAAGGTGVVALGVGVAFGFKMKSIEDEISKDTVYRQSRYDDGRAAERNMFVFTGVGVAAVVAGGVMYYLGHSAARSAERDTGPAVTLAPVVGPSHLALAATGSF